MDIVTTHKTNIESYLPLKSNLSEIFSKTKRIGDIKTSKVIEDVGLVDAYFPEDNRIYL